MVMLTGFADVISSDLKEQLDTLESEGIYHLELRGAHLYESSLSTFRKERRLPGVLKTK